MDNSIELPDLLLLSDYNGDYNKYIDKVYEIFFKDFVLNKTKFRGAELKLKWHPLFQEKAYTFYHITHKGTDEANREPDLRRCERLPWAKPSIESCDVFKLKVWPQKRGNSDRICIWLELIDEADYMIILDVRLNYTLLWTTFVIEYPHEKRKKQKEYDTWLLTQKSLGDT